jgi:hypothetical protein
MEKPVDFFIRNCPNVLIVFISYLLFYPQTFCTGKAITTNKGLVLRLETQGNNNYIICSKQAIIVQSYLNPFLLR